MTTFSTPTALETILQAIAAQLVSANVATTATQVIICVDVKMFEEESPTDVFFTLTPGRFSVDKNFVVGTGRLALKVDGRVAVGVWGRLGTDYPNRDSNWLTDAANGVLPRFAILLGALEQFVPPDGSGGSLLVEPMRLASFEAVPRKIKPGWGRVEAEFDVSFLYALS